MATGINKEYLNEFYSITGIDIVTLFTRIVTFLETKQQNIVSYYSGDINSLDQEAFKELQLLRDEIANVFDTYKLNRTQFKSFAWWLLIDQVEQFDNILNTIDNSSKWLRSSIAKNNFNPNPEINVPLKQGQTLESVTRNILGSDDSDNEWVDIAYNNVLEEENYTSDGGLLLKANLNYNAQGFTMNTIVDNIQGDNILGIDLDQKLTFESDDLKVLSPNDTFLQSINNLILLGKGDNPEFPNYGINKKLFIGSNINTITYPTLFRQLTEIFRTDDTIKSFSIVDITREQDGVFITFSVENRKSEFNKLSLKL